MFDPQKFMTNPLFLGGAALLSGEGMGSAMQGMRVGQMAQQQQREQEEAEKRRQQFLGLLNSPEIMANKSINPQMLMAMGPEAGLKHLANEMDPVTLLQRRNAENEASLFGLKRQQLQANIDATRASIGKRERTLQDDIAEREAAVKARGADVNDPQMRAYILTGRMPREDQQPITATDRKAIIAAETAVADYDAALVNMNRAKQLNEKAGEGFGNATLSAMWNKIGLGDDQTKAASEMEMLLNRQAVEDMSRTLKGATTDKELFKFIEMAGDVSLPIELRKNYLNLATQRLEILRNHELDAANQIRGGTYYKPQTQQPGQPPPTDLKSKYGLE